MATNVLDSPPATIAFDASLLGSGLKTILLVPDGRIESRNGVIVLDAIGAALVVGEFEKHGTPLPIDFEHQTLGGQYAAPNGRAAAAGWNRKTMVRTGSRVARSGGVERRRR